MLRVPAMKGRPLMTDEEKKLEVLQYLRNGSWLADTLHKESTDPKTVNDYDPPSLLRRGQSFVSLPRCERVE